MPRVTNKLISNPSMQMLGGKGANLGELTGLKESMYRMAFVFQPKH